MTLADLFGVPQNVLAFFGSVVASVIGFVALLLGALFNAHLNRRRDERLMRKECSSVMTAIYGEIIFLREELAGVARKVSNMYLNSGFDSNVKFDNNFVESARLPESVLYKALAPKIGVLESSLVLGITRFYANLELARKWIPLIVNDGNRGFNYSVLVILRPAVSAVKDVEATLKIMESRLNIINHGLEVDIGESEMVIDMEEEVFRS